MNGPQHDKPDHDHGLAAELARDADEARAIAPLVDAADPLPARWRLLLRRALPLLALTGLAAVLLVTGLTDELRWERLVDHHARIVAWKDAHPALAYIGLTAVMVALMASGLPGSLALAVFAGVLFGTIGGALLSTIGSTAGASVLFAAARHLFVGQRQPPALLARLRDGYQRHPVSFTFFIRLFPAFPMGPLSVALAWLGCPWWLFVTASATGSFVHGLVWCGIGAGMAHVLATHARPDLAMAGDPRLLLPLAGLAVLALLPIAFRRWRSPPA
jgi:uncharacterized membrane protein YdjX (TVP38/TMEM64 family)